uniref:B-cell differentiation antigen CD72-like n=1 Tax=Geotrypetes seraphini TaxID=260995 RepID=A0A6P8Q9P7_GEOSA|nr:B-cell differentiation antigen CD72-like [Geotrypetes seraphini]
MQLSQQMLEDHEVLNSSFSQSMRLKDKALKDTENKLHESEVRLKDTRDRCFQHLNHTEQELEDMRRNLGITQDLLTDSERKLKTSEEIMKTIEKERDQLNSDLKKKEELFADCALIESCPQGWKLAGGKCLYFSTTINNWETSKAYCEDADSSVLVFSKENLQVQEYIKQKRKEHWSMLPPYYHNTWRDGSKSKLYFDKKDEGIHVQSSHTFESWSYPWICVKVAHKITFQNTFPTDDVKNNDCIWMKRYLPYYEVL